MTHLFCSPHITDIPMRTGNFTCVPIRVSEVCPCLRDAMAFVVVVVVVNNNLNLFAIPRWLIGLLTLQ